jgi:hypothetical protein
MMVSENKLECFTNKKNKTLTPYIDDTILFPSSMMVSKNKLECFTIEKIKTFTPYIDKTMLFSSSMKE